MVKFQGPLEFVQPVLLHTCSLKTLQNLDQDSRFGLSLHLSSFGCLSKITSILDAYSVLHDWSYCASGIHTCGYDYKTQFPVSVCSENSYIPKTRNSWDTSRVSKNSTQFLHYLLGDSIRFQR